MNAHKVDVVGLGRGRGVTARCIRAEDTECTKQGITLDMLAGDKPSGCCTLCVELTFTYRQQGWSKGSHMHRKKSKSVSSS